MEYVLVLIDQQNDVDKKHSVKGHGNESYKTTTLLTLLCGLETMFIISLRIKPKIYHDVFQ